MNISIEGHSHGDCMRLTARLPAGIPLNEQTARAWLALRRPGQGTGASARNEPDQLVIEGGMHDGCTTTEPLVLRIDNVDVRSQDYHDLHRTPRPGHGDYPWHMHDPKNNLAGGARSGRLSALHVALAGLLDDWLQSKGIVVAAGLIAAGEVSVPWQGAAKELRAEVAKHACRGVDAALEAPILQARGEKDSIGGTVQFQADGVPVGLGGAWGMDAPSVLAKWLWQIPAVKAMEIGSGTAASNMRGSEHNDPLRYQDGVTFTKNDAGGVLGGRTTGQPLQGRITFKPTATIPQPQQTVDLETKQDTTLTMTGRHDACIAVRGAMVVQAMVALAITQLLIES